MSIVKRIIGIIAGLFVVCLLPVAIVAELFYYILKDETVCVELWLFIWLECFGVNDL